MKNGQQSILDRWRNDKNPVGTNGEDTRTCSEEEKAELLKTIRKIEDVEEYMNEKFGLSSKKSPNS